MSRSDVNIGVEDVEESLLSRNKSNVQTEVGSVAPFDPKENIRVEFSKNKTNEQFVGLTKEELKEYINSPKWKRIRWTIASLYILILILLLIGSILLVLLSPRCPPKPKRVWYEEDIIYEVDLSRYRDGDGDGIGDLQGFHEKLDYLENKNQIKSILIQSSLFDRKNVQSLQINEGTYSDHQEDLLTIDPLIGTERQLQNLTKILSRKNMHLLVDLPLSSTNDPTGVHWYGSPSTLPTSIQNPCGQYNNRANVGCRFYESYGRLPLDFAIDEIITESLSRLNYWLSKMKFDGVRVNLPLEFNAQTKEYQISITTIQKWKQLKNDIEKKSQPKLLLFDIPFALEDLVTNEDLNSMATHSLLITEKKSPIQSNELNERFQSFESKNLSLPKFWQLGSIRKSDEIGMIDRKDLSKEMILTLGLLFHGTPVILYGEEIGLDRTSNPYMSWSPDKPSGGFSSCSSPECLKQYPANLAKTSVKREEALGGDPKDSLLTVFRRLSSLRQSPSFQYGLLEKGFYSPLNIFWFIREASGHRGYIVLLNLNKNAKEMAHVSLPELTNGLVPAHVHYEYQWPKALLSKLNSTHIHSDNIFLSSQSINIFWWKEKLLKPNILFAKMK